MVNSLPTLAIIVIWEGECMGCSFAGQMHERWFVIEPPCRRDACPCKADHLLWSGCGWVHINCPFVPPPVATHLKGATGALVAISIVHIEHWLEGVTPWGSNCQANHWKYYPEPASFTVNSVKQAGGWWLRPIEPGTSDCLPSHPKLWLSRHLLPQGVTPSNHRSVYCASPQTVTSLSAFVWNHKCLHWLWIHRQPDMHPNTMCILTIHLYATLMSPNKGKTAFCGSFIFVKMTVALPSFAWDDWGGDHWFLAK